MPSPSADIATLPFEQAMQELEEIVAALEKSSVSLDESVKLYERGEALKKRCDALLAQAVRWTQAGASAENPLAPAAPLRSQGIEAVARLVQLTRRRLGVSPEQFAAQTDLELRELVALESAQAAPEPRVLYQLSQVLEVSYEKLLTLVGHRQRRDEVLEREALLFEAHSGPMDRLSKSESQALQDFIRALSD